MREEGPRMQDTRKEKANIRDVVRNENKKIVNRKLR